MLANVAASRNGAILEYLECPRKKELGPAQSLAHRRKKGSEPYEFVRLTFSVIQERPQRQVRGVIASVSDPDRRRPTIVHKIESFVFDSGEWILASDLHRDEVVWRDRSQEGGFDSSVMGKNR